MQTLPMASSELMHTAPLGAWVAVSADQMRIVAFGDDPEKVFEQAVASGEEDVVLAKNPPSWGSLVL